MNRVNFDIPFMKAQVQQAPQEVPRKSMAQLFYECLKGCEPELAQPIKHPTVGDVSKDMDKKIKEQEKK